MKYVAQQVPPEHQDSDWRGFIDDDGRLWSIAVFDRRGINTNHVIEPFRRALVMIQAFPDCKSRMNCWLDALVGEELYDTYAKEICELRGQNRPEWQTARQSAKRVARNYMRSEQYRPDQVQSAAELLSAVTGIKFIVRDIRGCSQGDYARLIIPQDECTENKKDEIEARFFNTGTQWKIESEDGDSMYAYTWDTESQDSQIREQCDICTADELEIYAFDGWEKTAKYVRI